eukprot:3124005-Karenia_brevis.AAC.1
MVLHVQPDKEARQIYLLALLVLWKLDDTLGTGSDRLILMILQPTPQLMETFLAANPSKFVQI